MPKGTAIFSPSVMFIMWNPHRNLLKLVFGKKSGNNIGLIFSKWIFFFLLKMYQSTNLQNIISALICWVINKTALSSEIGRDCIRDRYFRVKAHRKYMRFCALEMNEGHMVDLEVVVYLKYKEFHEKYF